METPCMFASSKYYRQAYADAQKISQPLGYNFLSQKQQLPRKKQADGPLIRKLLFDKPLIKTLSNKPTPQQKVKQFLSVSDSKRKNTYLSVNPLSIINRTSEQICQELSTKYFPQIDKQNTLTLDYVNSINTISDDVYFAINDYALSTYLIFYFGKNPAVKKIINNHFQNQFVEYNVQTLGAFHIGKDNFQGDLKKPSIIEFDETQIKKKQKIDEFIAKIHKAGTQIDPMFSGIHFFVGDSVSFTSNHEILKEEIDNLKYLQFFLYLITSRMLGNGQNALIKIRGTMRNKTIDYLFLFKLVFSKITLIKPAFSNFLTPQKYLFCEGYLIQNGDEVHKYISDNFDLLAEHGQQKLLVNPQLIFREQSLTDNTKNFNDSLIVRGLKEVLDTFLKNSNLQIYPPKTALIEKLQSFSFKEELADIIDIIEKKVPNEEEIKNEANQDGNNGKNNKSNELKGLQIQPIVEEKQASIDIFELLKKAKQDAKPAPKQVNPPKPKVDESDQIEGKLLQRYKEQQRIREQKKRIKKENQKKSKKQKEQQDPYLYSGSRFDMAEN